ncbi:MAG: hypothetical protein HY908_03305 [Myxococcales bacterium]|nr:hypothetical protein [Myxococcales bacterium]
MRTYIALAALLLAACPKSPPPPPPAAPAPSAKAPGAENAERPRLTASACEAEGGKVVGDIGDGAIHRPDYVCPESGKPPLGTIAADPGGPMGVEGAVCCK